MLADDEAQIGIMWSHGGRAKHGRYGINLSDGIVVINEDGTLSLVDEKGKTLRTIVPSDAVQKKLRLLVIACKQKKSEWGKVVKNTNLTTSDDEKTNGHKAYFYLLSQCSGSQIDGNEDEHLTGYHETYVRRDREGKLSFVTVMTY